MVRPNRMWRCNGRSASRSTRLSQYSLVARHVTDQGLGLLVEIDLPNRSLELVDTKTIMIDDAILIASLAEKLLLTARAVSFSRLRSAYSTVCGRSISFPSQIIPACTCTWKRSKTCRTSYLSRSYILVKRSQCDIFRCGAEPHAQGCYFESCPQGWAATSTLGMQNLTSTVKCVQAMASSSFVGLRTVCTETAMK